MNVTLQESAFLKLQLEGEHAKYGCVGFTAAVDKLQLKVMKYAILSQVMQLVL